MAFPEATRFVDDVVPGPFPQNPAVYRYSSNYVDNRWDRSDRVGGELILKPQRAEMITLLTRLRMTGQTYNRRMPVPYRVGAGMGGGADTAEFPNRVLNRSSSLPSVWSRLDNRARARLLGKIDTPQASLAITLSQWRSAASMLNLNGKSMLGLVNRFHVKTTGYRRVNVGLKGVRKGRPGQVADAYLEFIFGWGPLYAELVALCEILTSHEFLETYIRASSGEEALVTNWNELTTGTYGTWNRGAIRETCRSVLSARVKIQNPNFWMANQLGLLNLPGAAVDIIPWSFVTGMFWNQAQFVSQLTDTIGLGFSDISLTRSYRATYSGTRTANGSGYRGQIVREHDLVQKKRELNSLPSVSASFKDFEMDLSKATMFLALAAQKLQKIPVSVLNPRLGELPKLPPVDFGYLKTLLQKGKKKNASSN